MHHPLTPHGNTLETCLTDSMLLCSTLRLNSYSTLLGSQRLQQQHDSTGSPHKTEKMNTKMDNDSSVSREMQ